MPASLFLPSLQICSVDISLPLLLPPDGNLASQLDLSPLPSSLSPLSPFAGRDDKRWSQALSLRGLPSDYPLRSGLRTTSHVYSIYNVRHVYTSILFLHDYFILLCLCFSSPEDSRYTFCHHPSHILAAHLAETAPSINRSSQLKSHCPELRLCAICSHLLCLTTVSCAVFRSPSHWPHLFHISYLMTT